MALDSGTATMTQQLRRPTPIHIGRFTIDDYHGKHRWLTVPEIFMYSSNIGSARWRWRPAPSGSGTSSPGSASCKRRTIELDEVGAPHYPGAVARSQHHDDRLRPWHLGHAAACRRPARRRSSMAASCIQPTLLKRRPATRRPAQRVISAKTSEQMRQLLRLVVEHGTGKMAEAPGYVVGGKTGTAEKDVGRRLRRKEAAVALSSACFR